MPSLTLADQTRLIAERIGNLGEEVRSAFQLLGIEERLAHLKHVEAEILAGMLGVTGWLERHQPAAADLARRRMKLVLDESVGCAGMDIPELTGGMGVQLPGQLTPGMKRTSTLMVTATAFADSLREWADLIEAEEKEQNRHKAPSEAEVLVPRVELLPERLVALIRDKQKPITLTQKKLIAALLAAGPDGLRLDDMHTNSGVGDARHILNRLRRDPDWAWATRTARKAGRRYAVLYDAKPPQTPTETHRHTHHEAC